MRSWSGTIYGEPASKANSRQLVISRRTGKPMFIRSAKARRYADDVARQVPLLSPLLAGRLRFTATIYYASERPDLDESIILDALQGFIYRNDRDVREKHVIHAIDRANPRAVVTVEELSPLFSAPVALEPIESAA